MTDTPILDVRSLAVELGGRLALNGVDLTVRTGELVGLIGPNGAGKTTLLRTVLGLLTPHSGVVHLQGQPADRARGTVGYVPQRHEFAWDFPCRWRRPYSPAVPTPSAGCAAPMPPTVKRSRTHSNASR
ncbi:ATP-binding cassette domain-containing protein [Streptomyces shenzhenensis]|uniref:ATP-binding cassette domain-containing protein n=1 Tax=Streptomyces shenzhenensis TaxID=943815 RepID=UPI003D8B5C5C